MTTTDGAQRATVNEVGRERRRRAQGAKADQLQGILAGFDQGMADYADDFIFGQIWGRPGLSFDERMVVAITALAAGEHPNQLRNYLHGALQDGMPASKIHEIMVMLAVYCGFPTALEGMRLWQEVLEAARRQGIEIDLDEP